MIEIWFRFRFLILFIGVIVITFCSYLIFKEVDIAGSITTPLILGITILWFYLVHYYGQVNKDFKEYHLSKVSKSFVTGKNLTVISYHLMNADGEISKLEKTYFENFMFYEFERKFIVKYYIKNLNLFHKKISLKKACLKLNNSLRYSGKVQLLHFYISLITKDKFLSVGEIALLRKICKYSGIHYKTLDAVLAMFNYTSEEDLNKKTYAKTYKTNSIKKYYTILEIEETATEEEIKTAYRDLVKIYHPDKQFGKEKLNLSIAKQKFQAIQEAYDKIKQHKGI